MRYDRYAYLEEANEIGTAASGGAADAAGAVAPAGAETATTAADVKSDAMADAISQGLGYTEKPPGTEGATAGQTPEEKAAAKAAADTQAAEALAVKQRDEKAAAGDPDAIKAKQDAEAKAKAEAAKPKDLKTLELTEADKRVMKGKTAERYNEVLTIAKAERVRAETAERNAVALSGSRDAILSVLKETNTTQEDLGNLLEFNRLLKSGKPEDMETALKVVTNQRLALLKALGREGDGHDPLTEFADLLQDVEDQKITRERALELAAVRKRDAITQANSDATSRAQQSEQQRKDAHVKAVNDGLASIDTWTAGIAKADIDFKAKEAILLPRIEGIIRAYPPNLWLQTIKTVYDSIVVTKAAPPLPNSGNTPLRPSGAKPGGPAPTTMNEAIDQGLGYAKT